MAGDCEPGPSGSSAGDWLVGGGEMAKLIKAKDWSATPLGPLETWPQSLRTTLSLAQASNSPISIAWGEGHTQIYNDGYWPICGAKHPTAMGQDFRECWASAFEVLDEAYASAWSGKSAYLEKVRMFLDRYGFLEETWFTFSFSPITGEAGNVAGLFHPVTELTAQMLWERRAKVLRELATRTSNARTSADAFAFALDALKEASFDLPFVLLYSVSADGGQAQRVGHTGIDDAARIGPELVELAEQPKVSKHEPSRGAERDQDAWRVDEVALGAARGEIADVAQRLRGLAVGPYPELPTRAFALPIMQPGKQRPTAVMVAGISARLALNDAYLDFLNLVAAGISTGLANARAYEEERSKAESLAQIDRAKTVFFSNVSHEFRTPLTLILGPLEDELAERDPLPSPGRTRLETVHRNSLRLLKLVNTLLDFSRLEAGRIEAQYQALDLAQETSELASAFRSAFERAGLLLTVDCPALPQPIYVDREMWEKVVLNLLSNALKHTFEGGVTVRQRWHGDHVLLTVTDTGVGIPAAELPRLFERFHRVQGAQSRSHEGTGIGLALVHELVRLHQGAVSVESTEKQGSTFTVKLKTGNSHLPGEKVRAEPSGALQLQRVREHVQEALQWLPESGDMRAAPPGTETGADLPEGEPERTRARARVVWADDNVDMRDYVRRLLSQHYQVFAVPDGEAAFEAVLREQPDLVLSDVMMPVLDGFGLLKKLRADSKTRNIPIILLSARAGEESAIEGLSAGADDYLIKPFSAKELLARVRTHLELARERRGHAEELARANEELGAFSYSVSHDLRAPLRAIDGFSKALLNDYSQVLDDMGRHYLQRIRAGSQRMSTLIDDLLSLSRISRSLLKRDMLNLSRIAEGVVNELQAREPARQVAVEIASGLTARGDARLLTIALENLLGNAFKFTAKSERAQIWVGREQLGDEQVYFVRDSGAGFDMAYASKLFAPFQRLHGDSEFEGTGIGLATVQRIVARHGGRIWAQATKGQGATFFFTLGEAV